MNIEAEILEMIRDNNVVEDISLKLAILFDKYAKTGMSYETFVDKVIVVLTNNRISIQEISSALAITRANIRKRINIMRKQGIEIADSVKAKESKIRKLNNDKIDDKIVDGLNNKNGVYEIANNLELTRTAVYARINRIKKRGVEFPNLGNLPKKPSKTHNDEIDDKIKEGIEKGENYTEIGKELNISHQRVSQRANDMRKRGEDIPIAKRGQQPRTKNDETDDRITEKLLDGTSISQIARDLGFSREAICYRIKKMGERDKPKLAKMIVELFLNTGRGTMEQVKALGEYYGVDIEDVLKSLDEKER